MPTSEFPTLADAAIAESKRVRDPKILKPFASAIAQARRFVVDDAGSRFMSDLGNASFCALETDDSKADKEALAKLADQVRIMARIPFPLTWIEYNGKEIRKRSVEVHTKVRHGQAKINQLTGEVIFDTSVAPETEDVIERCGFLLRQLDDHSIMASYVVGYHHKEHHAVITPWSYVWSFDDTIPLQKNVYPGNASEVSLGIPSYNSPHVILTNTPGYDLRHYRSQDLNTLITEFVGNIRYLWALLAAVNDVPTSIRKVEQAKGVQAPSGKRRDFISHSVISILLPKGRNPITVARQVVMASRRKRHEVRPHYRLVHKTANACQTFHDFKVDGDDNTKLECTVCKSYKRWIKLHERGDATLGYVTHSYEVTTEEKT